MNLKACLLGASLALILIPLGDRAVADEMPYFFKHGCWLCATAEAYAPAVEAMQNLNGRTFEELREELAGKCYYLEDDQVTDVGPPYIKIVESAGDMRKLSFVLQIEQKTAARAGNIIWYNFTGWTHADNIKQLWSAD